MRVINFQHQYRVIAANQYIESWRIPCEGTLSRVEGSIIIVAKDYTNQPTFTAVDITWLNSVYHMMPDATLNFTATFAGAAVVPVPTFKDSDVGIPVEGIITTGGELLTITITVGVVPDPFMLYIRPMIKVYGLTTVANQKKEGIELTYTPADSTIPHRYDPILPDMPGYPDVNAQVSGIEVIKENLRPR